MPGGDPFLLNLAGAAMTDNKLWKEADDFYDRAQTSTEDEALIRKIKQNRNLNKRRVKLNLLLIKIYHKAGET